jgi:hypothetical protein
MERVHKTEWRSGEKARHMHVGELNMYIWMKNGNNVVGSFTFLPTLLT